MRAVELLRNNEVLGEFVPEVRMNIAYSIPNAKTIHDVAAIPGRITTYKGFLLVNNYPAFGGSDHLARALIEVQKYEDTPKEMTGLVIRNNFAKMEVRK